MKHYRSYMDRITAPAGLRQRVLEAAEQGARPRRPAASGKGCWRRRSKGRALAGPPGG